MNTLDNCRIRHAMLINVRYAMKTYLDCMEHGYLGTVSPLEQKAIEQMKNTMLTIEENCHEYYAEQFRIVGDI